MGLPVGIYTDTSIEIATPR